MSTHKIAIAQRVTAIQVVMAVLRETSHGELLQHYVLLLLFFVSVYSSFLGLSNNQLWSNMVRGSLRAKIGQGQFVLQVLLLVLDHIYLALDCCLTY